MLPLARIINAGLSSAPTTTIVCEARTPIQLAAPIIPDLLTL